MEDWEILDIFVPFVYHSNCISKISIPNERNKGLAQTHTLFLASIDYGGNHGNALTNFVAVYAFFSKITTHWWQVRYVPYRWHSKEPNYCTGISLTQVVIDLWLKTWKILIFAYFLLLLHNDGLYWSKTVIFEFLGTFLTRSIEYFFLSCFIFVRNCTKSSKIRHRSAVPP